MSAGDWRGDALCAQVDTELFFPEKGGSTREAKAVCRACPVTAECLAYALGHQENLQGVWGGVAERTRLRIRRARGATRPTGRPRREAA